MALPWASSLLARARPVSRTNIRMAANAMAGRGPASDVSAQAQAAAAQGPQAAARCTKASSRSAASCTRREVASPVASASAAPGRARARLANTAGRMRAMMPRAASCPCTRSPYFPPVRRMASRRMPALGRMALKAAAVARPASPAVDAAVMNQPDRPSSRIVALAATRAQPEAASRPARWVLRSIASRRPSAVMPRSPAW